MSSRGELIQQRSMLRAAFEGREPKRPIFRGLTGDGTGLDSRTHVRVDDEPTRMYVRVTGRGVLEAVVGVNVPMRHDVPVYVGPTQENLDVYEVLGINFGEVQDPGGYAYVASHHWSHEFGSAYGADDIVWVSKEQFLPFLAAPTDPPSTALYAFAGFYLYLTAWQYFPGGNTGDLTLLNPAAGLAKYVLVSINAVTNVLTVTDGVAFAPFPPSNPATHIPQCPAQHFPLMAVYLLNTTATITWDNLYDVRLMVGGGVNTTVPGPHHLLDVIVHDDTVAWHAPVTGDLIYGNLDVPPAWDALAIGTARDFLMVTAGGTLPEWRAFDWDLAAAGAGADMAHYHSSAVEGGARLYDIDQFGLSDNAVDCLTAINYPRLPYYSYTSLDNVRCAAPGTTVTSFWNTWPVDAYRGSIRLVDADEIAFCTAPKLSNSGNIKPAANKDVSVTRHPLMFVRSHWDGNWYEIGWSGASGGMGAHNVLSATHGDSEPDAVQRGAIITGQLNHPGAVLAWTRLGYPGTRHHLQTDGLDVIWDEDVMMATTHWIGLGDATGYGTGEGRIAFYDMGLGNDVIANLDADVGVGTIHPNIAGEAVALTIESAIGAPTLELSRLDDILPASAMVGVIRWFSGVDPQCAQAQIDVIQTGYYEGQSIMEFWAADDCALCHVMDLDCDGLNVYGYIATDFGDRWDLEDYHAGAPTPDGYVRVDINGVTYKLAAELVP